MSGHWGERQVTIRGLWLQVPGSPPVFIPEADLEELSEQGRWDSQFGRVLTLDAEAGRVLVAHGLAERETRGGYHGTDLLRELLAQDDRTGQARVNVRVTPPGTPTDDRPQPGAGE